MALKLSVDLQNKIAQDIGAALTSGEFKIYSGTRPATPADAPSGTLLVTISGATFGTTATGGFIGLTNMPSGTAAASGTAAWFRYTKGSYIVDGDIPADMAINDTAIVVDKAVTVVAWVIHQPAG